MLQASLIGVLHDRESTMAELGRLLDLDKSITTGLIDRAVHRGLVRRVPVPEDGRSFRVVRGSGLPGEGAWSGDDDDAVGGVGRVGPRLLDLGKGDGPGTDIQRALGDRGGELGDLLDEVASGD